MGNKKYKNKLIYFLTIIVVIIVYLIIQLYGSVVKDEIRLERSGYENSTSTQPINNIISVVKKDNPIDETIKDISFARKNVSVKIGDTMKLIVRVNPSSLASSDFTWESSDPSVVSVDSHGNIRGLKEGTAIITVTSPNGKTATVKITVVKDDIKVKKIDLNPSTLSIYSGSVKQIEANVEPENATNGDLKWTSSNPKVATVDENGVVKGISPGTAIITVKTKDGTVTTQIKVTVNPKITVEVGDKEKIDPNTITKPTGITNKDLVYESSNPNVATVDKNGVVTGVAPGVAIITVKTKDGEVIDRIPVVVRDKIAIEVGEKDKINPNEIEKPAGITNNDLVYESSNPKVATVDKNGNVTGVAPGVAIITVKTKDGEVIDEYTVIVEDKIDVNVGETKKIDPSIIDKPTGVTNKDLVYESSNPNIATVDENGNVTGVTPGTTVITVKTKDGEIIDKIIVVVKDKINVEVGETEKIDPDTIDKPDGVTNKDLVYESSNPTVATVDENGNVTGVAPGTTEIIVKTKDGEIIDKIPVVVEDKISVDVGETKKIDPNTIDKPDGVTNKDLVYESSDPNIATVDENGNVTGVTPGTTEIIVKTKDGEIVDKIIVVVEPKETDAIIFEYDYDEGNYIDLNNQFPTKDEVGKALHGDKHTNDFKLKFNTGATGVKYVITMEKLDGSDLKDEWVKTYLVRDGADVNNCLRSNGKVKSFDEYQNYKGNSKEKILYEGTVTSTMASRGYEDYTFRMWVSEDVMINNTDDNMEDVFSNRTYKIRINVYAFEQ